MILLAIDEGCVAWTVLYRRESGQMGIAEIQAHPWADGPYWLRRSLDAWRGQPLRRWACCRDQLAEVQQRLDGLLDHLTPGTHPNLTAPTAELRMRLLRIYAGRGILTDDLRVPGDPRPGDEPQPQPRKVGVQTALLSRA